MASRWRHSACQSPDCHSPVGSRSARRPANHSSVTPGIIVGRGSGDRFDGASDWRSHHRAAPEGGSGRDAIESPAHARGIVRDITNALMAARATLRTQGPIHLFLATPLAFAVLLGHALNGFGPICLYELRAGTQEYVRTLTIGGQERITTP